MIGLLVRCSECPLATMCSGQRRLKPARDFGPATYWSGTRSSALSRPRRAAASRCQSLRRWARGRQGPSAGTAGSASVTVVYLPRQSPLGPGTRARRLHQRRIRTAAPNGKQPSAHELPRRRHWGACSSRRCVQWGPRAGRARPGLLRGITIRNARRRDRPRVGYGTTTLSIPVPPSPRLPTSDGLVCCQPAHAGAGITGSFRNPEQNHLSALNRSALSSACTCQ